jgi:hypothetical protein
MVILMNESEEKESARLDLEKEINDLLKEDDSPFECPYCHNKENFSFYFDGFMMNLKEGEEMYYEVHPIDDRIWKPDPLIIICENPNCRKVVLESSMY